MTSHVSRILLHQSRSRLSSVCCAKRTLSSVSVCDSDFNKAPTAIYHSHSHNPWFNLAFEDWIFRKTPPSQIVLYIYRNDPCVVIGRNQNPWKEINLGLLRKLGVPFVRRRSGGGTVYHDLGNTNYCVFVPRSQFERKTNALLVSDALNNIDINTYVNERNDICIDGYKIIQARAYHHGTMLIDARLGDLRGVLSNDKKGMVSKGVESVPSPVKNLVEWDPLLDHQAFFETVANQFIHVYGGNRNAVHDVDESELDKKDYVRDVFEELQTWEWQWGQTPEFTHTMKADFAWGSVTFNVTSRHGIITAFECEGLEGLPHSRQKAWDRAQIALTGQRYEDVSALEALAPSLGTDDARETVRDIASFLSRSM